MKSDLLGVCLQVLHPLSTDLMAATGGASVSAGHPQVNAEPCTSSRMPVECPSLEARPPLPG